jgi:phage tail protein X
MIYRTRDDDVLDRICRVHYGPRDGVTELVVAANPGLASHGPVLSSGILITLPDLPPEAPTAQIIRLWD